MRLGHSLFSAGIKYPSKIEIGAEFSVKLKCQPRRRPVLPRRISLPRHKNFNGGIVAVFVDESLGVTKPFGRAQMGSEIPESS